jgi:mono/diheme cytochrome c family protein
MTIRVVAAWALLSPILCAALLPGAALGAGRGPRPPTAEPAAGGVGQSIYLRGVLGSGEPLQGNRDAGVAAAGSDAACASCHQRSGLGAREGNVTVPPITGQYLFASRAREAGEPGSRVGSRLEDRDPYTDETLARAIREGLDSQGRPLGYLMPRYALGDEDMAALILYLEQLDARPTPGVTETVLHFATIVTPDADPRKRSGMLDVLEKFVAQKNRAPLRPTPSLRTSRKTRYAKAMYLANRHWRLHVWELTGPAQTWRAQLEKRLAAEPVYAVLSGLGGSNWAPVHEFCEQHAVPCLFPNVEVPVVEERDFYPVYFSKGVLLEAELIARAILEAGDHPAAVEQVYRAGDSGEAGARALAAQLEGHGVTVHRTILPAGARGQAVAAALSRGALHRAARHTEVRGGQALVLWLRPDDIAALGEVPARAASVYLSGLMGGLERAPLPAGWREHALMTYPFDLPGKRIVRLDYAFGFFRFQHIPVVDERVQTDTFLACSVVAEILKHMGDDFSRPYLVEKLQAQLEHRLITGYYPRLALASRQRFASKGGYLVRFRDGGTALVAQGDWIVP